MAGNANSGKHKAKAWRDTLLLIVNRDDNELPARGKTVLESLVLKSVAIALDGDAKALNDIADRLDGKPAQSIIGGDDYDNPIQVAVGEAREFIARKLASLAARADTDANSE